MATERRRMAIEPGLHVRPRGSDVSVHVLLEAGLQRSEQCFVFSRLHGVRSVFLVRFDDTFPRP